MDPAEQQHLKPLQDAIAFQGELLGRHEHQLASVMQSMQDLSLSCEKMAQSVSDQLARFSAVSSPPQPPSLSVSASSSSGGPEPRLAPPERFGGDEGTCRSFLIQCSLIFELQPSSYPTERSRVAYVITLLTGKPREWATREWENGSPICSSFAQFSMELKKIFDNILPGRETAKGLLGLRQGGRRVADYAIDFRTLAADSKWNSFSLADAFYHGLSENIKDELATCEPSTDLDFLISLSTRIDNRLRARQRERSSARSSWSPREWRPIPPGTHFPATTAAAVPSSYPSASPSSSQFPVPMQIGHTRLTSEERKRRISDHCCLYCGRPGHFKDTCPAKEKAPH